MDEAGFCFICMIFLMSWRTALFQFPSIRNNCVTVLEKKLGKMIVGCCGGHTEYLFGRGTPFFEWWFIAIVALTIMIFNNFYDVVIWDYSRSHRLVSGHSSSDYNYADSMDKNWEDAAFADEGNVTTFDGRSISIEQLRHELHIPLWLRGIAMAAPSVGVLAFAMFLAHLRNFVLNYMRQKIERMEKPAAPADGMYIVGDKVHVQTKTANCTGTVSVVDIEDPNGIPYKVEFESDGKKWSDWFEAKALEKVQEDINPWVADEQEDLAILVVMGPAVFVMLAMKAEIRMLQLMLVTSTHGAKTWFEFSMPLMGEKNLDMELAAICQFVTVFAFATLSKKFFNLNFIEQMVRKRETLLFKKLDHLLKNGEKLELGNGLEMEDLLDVIHHSNKQHKDSLSRAGLLGVWAHIFVGICRALVLIVVSIGMQSKDPEIVAQVSDTQAQVLAYLEPVFSFSTLLCMVNMKIILDMDALKDEQAFGKYASLMFLAARVLIILADTQLQVAKAAAKILFDVFEYEVSPYQIELLHVSLLEIWCLGLVVFNSYMWKETVRSRSETTWKIKRGNDTLVAKILQHEARLQLIALSIGMPLMVLLWVLLFGTSSGGGPVDDPPHAVLAQKIFDILMQSVGIGMTFLPFCLSCCCLGWRPAFLDSTHNSHFGWLPRGWRPAQLLVLVFQVWFRWIMLCFVGPFHYYFSDHVYLGMSMLTAVIMELAMASVAIYRGVDVMGGRVVWAGCLVFSFFLFWDMWVTAMYYHTPSSVWAAYVLGLFTFVPVALWWVVNLAVKRHEGKIKAVGPKEPLMLDNAGVKEPLMLDNNASAAFLAGPPKDAEVGARP